MNGTDGRICYRCSAISWEKLRPEVTERVFVCAITESVQELKRSSCPTCRVLGVAVDHRRLTKLEFASAVNQSRSIKLETTPDSTRSNLHLVYSRGLFSLKDNSHMLHAFPSPLKLCDRDDPYLLDLQADAPNRVDFELAKLWMADCGTHEKCNIPPKSDIDNLKVIDCHQRRIISAPEKCKFVALLCLGLVDVGRLYAVSQPTKSASSHGGGQYRSYYLAGFSVSMGRPICEFYMILL
jgi:hypothetical protein